MLLFDRGGVLFFVFFFFFFFFENWEGACGLVTGLVLVLPLGCWPRLWSEGKNA